MCSLLHYSAQIPNPQEPDRQQVADVVRGLTPWFAIVLLERPLGLKDVQQLEVEVNLSTYLSTLGHIHKFQNNTYCLIIRHSKMD